MARSDCPKCGATMQPTMIGEHLKDKVLKCAHCGHTVDVPDEHEVRRVEERSLGGGRYERIETIERRRDLHPSTPIAPLPPDIARLLDTLGGGLQVVGPDGKSVELPKGMKLDRVQILQDDHGNLTGIVAPDGTTIPLPPGWKPDQIHFLQGLPPGSDPPIADLSTIPWGDGKTHDRVELMTRIATTPQSGSEFKIVFSGGSAMVVLFIAVVALVGLLLLLAMLK